MISVVQDAGLFLLASSPSGGGGEGPSMFQTFGFMALIFVVFWFFMIRPQKQKQKQRESMLKALEKGDKIVTIGGVRGSVTKVSDTVITVKVDDNCKMDFSRSAIAEVVLDEAEVARRTESLKSGKKAVGSTQAEDDKNEKQGKGDEGAL